MFLDGFLGGRSREHPWSMVHPWSMAHPWCMVVHLQSMVQDEDASMLRLKGKFLQCSLKDVSWFYGMCFVVFVLLPWFSDCF